MKCRAQTHLPRGLRFPVPLDKGNEGSGDEIARRRRAISLSMLKVPNVYRLPRVPLASLAESRSSLAEFFSHLAGSLGACSQASMSGNLISPLAPRS